MVELVDMNPDPSEAGNFLRRHRERGLCELNRLSAMIILFYDVRSILTALERG